MAAAIRASVAALQQPELRRGEDGEEGSRPKKEEAGQRRPEEPRGSRRVPRTQGEGPGEAALPARQDSLGAWHWKPIASPWTCRPNLGCLHVF